jgi:hypothetical protein
MTNRERIDRDYLVKAENILVDAICAAKRNEDTELVEALAKVCGELYKSRAKCWPDED